MKMKTIATTAIILLPFGAVSCEVHTSGAEPSQELHQAAQDYATEQAEVLAKNILGMFGITTEDEDVTEKESDHVDSKFNF